MTLGAMGVRARSIVAWTLLVVAVIGASLSMVVVYTDRNLLDGDRFADRAVTVLEEDEVADAIASRLADEVIAQNQDLIPSRPVVEGTIRTLIDTRAFEALFRRAVIDVHATLFSRDTTILLNLADIGIVLGAALDQVRPDLADDVPTQLQPTLIEIADRDFTTGTLELADRLEGLALLVPILTVLLAAGAIAISPARRRLVLGLGLGVAAAGAVVIALQPIARGIALNQFSDQRRDIAEIVWRAYFGGLLNWAIVAIVAGVVVAAAAGSLVRPIELRGRLEALARWITTVPERRWIRLARAGGLLAVALVVVIEPIGVLRVLALFAGILLAAYALGELLRVLAPAEPERPVDLSALRPPSSAMLARVGVVVAVLLALGAVFWNQERAGADEVDPERTITTCNGHAELCDRRLDEVALASTHNSMSAAREDFLGAMHDGGIVDQLDYGVRGLLVDTWYGSRSNRTVRTDLEMSGVSRQDQIDLYGTEVVTAAERVANRVAGARREPVGTYLCHAYCELGATNFNAALGDIRSWLIAHPDEVVVLFLQDQISPRDTELAFRRSRLLDLVYTHPEGAEFPTLREMIADDTRVLVMAENDAGDVPWYVQGFDVTQETPYRFTKPEDMSCQPNRGGTDKPLFQLNHWIERPQPTVSDARTLNAHDFLLDRARECQAERNAFPNLIAVNYYSVGDLIAVVDELNEVAAPAAG